MGIDQGRLEDRHEARRISQRRLCDPHRQDRGQRLPTRIVAQQRHEYASYDVELTLYACTVVLGQVPYPASVNDLRWVTSREFLDYDFPPADERTMTKLLGLIRN